MTTSQSPVSALRAQAKQLAATLKAAERGERIDVRFAEKIEAARGKDTFKVGIIMDDKVVTIDMPWTTIRETTEAGLVEWIVERMRGARHAVN